MPKVKNINGTSNNNCNCGNWISHWKIYSNMHPEFCSVKSCIAKYNLVGAHVQKTTDDYNWYIIPLCQTHNMSKDELEVGNVKFVSANVSLTCG